ncbi:MAG: hypothetical protein MK108_11980 [Mariniblastus sp.]|nr:hypothetical protein [Mariniblastus sp.]
MLPFVILGSLAAAAGLLEEVDQPQYHSGDIRIPAARSDEPVNPEFSLSAAQRYLASGSRVWTEQRKCISCHTNGTFMQLAPAMPGLFDQEVQRHRAFFVDEVNRLAEAPVDSLKQGYQPTQLAYLAQGLASFDLHGRGQLSAETSLALDLMLQSQSEDGSYQNVPCWPPLESSEYHSATVAAQALGLAPGYFAQASPAQQATIARLKHYLQATEPPHDYARVLLLWAANRWDGLISDKEKRSIIEMILSHQKEDGGWSIRTFGTPETWARGARSEKLRAEPEFNTEPSDGHQTGLVILVLREAGVAADHAAIRSGVGWLKSNQRLSGRWWTRSLNTDKAHFITYSGTFYPLVALQMCDELPPADSRERP